MLLAAHSKPYLVLEIEWGGGVGTYYYLDRPQNSFAASGQRLPTDFPISSCLVLDWGAITLETKEYAVAAVDSLTVKLQDAAGEISNILTNSIDRTVGSPTNGKPVEQQYKTVKIWRMFDDPTVVWGTDNALVFEGITKPHQYQESDNSISIQVDDPTRSFIPALQCQATQAIFPNIQPQYQDRNIPLVWGYCNRVEAILVDQPWQTRIMAAVNVQDAVGVTVPIQDSPVDLKINTSAELDVYIGTDTTTRAVRGKFITNTNGPSSFKITNVNGDAGNYTLTTATIDTVTGSGTNGATAIVLDTAVGSPYQTSLATVVANGSYCQVQQSGQWVDATVNAITASTGYYTITFNESNVQQALAAGQAIVFTNLDTSNFQFPAGSYITPQTGNWVYAVNALPSKQIYTVEGWGLMSDATGPGAHDFILLADTANQTTITEDGSTRVVTQSSSTAWTANLNDNTWNLYTLQNTGTLATNDIGHAITTITFNQAPRFYNPSLDDNRIWVTLAGVEDHGDSTGNLITSPALVLLQYLENPYLCNIDLSLIDIAAFEAASTITEVTYQGPGDGYTLENISDVSVGFAQVDAQGDGLAYLQDIARQMRSMLFFDQGLLSLVILRNPPPPALPLVAATFDETCLLEASLQVAENDISDTKTRITADWTYEWDDKKPHRKILAINAAAEQSIGIPNGMDMPIWLYSNSQQVQREIAFWLTKWSCVYRICEFTAFHKALVLQPGDWIQLSYTESDGRVVIPGMTGTSTVYAEVLSVSDMAPSGLVKVKCRFMVFYF